MSDRLRLALVGCGAISEMHRLSIADSGAPIDITAVVDIDTDRAAGMAERTGASAYGSLSGAIDAGGFDAVDLMLPHHLHEDVSTEAFAAGLHVLLEKPMAPTVAACERIMAAAAAAGTVFMVAENAQYWPEVRTACDLLADEAIGDVVTARACAFFPPLDDFYGGDRPWRFDPAVAGGGIAIDTCSHWVRPLRMMLGEVTEVTGALGTPYPGMEAESLVRALLRFESGVVAGLDALLTAAPIGPEMLFRVTGSRGEITVDAAGRCLLYDADRRRGEQVGEAAGYLASYPGEFVDFAAAVLDGTPPAANAASSLGELRTALALYRSAANGRWERVWD
jgi:predicted dehydrogenase